MHILIWEGILNPFQCHILDFQH